MLSNIWKTISRIGITENLGHSETRYVVLTNRIAIFCSLFAIINFLFLKIVYGTGVIIGPENLSLVFGASFSMVLWSNKKNLYSFSKSLISWLPIIILVSISIYEKKQHFEYLTVQDFYSYRFVILAISIVPVLVISTKQKWFLLFNLLPGFLGVILFGVIHDLLGIGVNDMGFGYNDPSLFVFDAVSFLSYFALIGFLLSQMVVFERHESESQKQRVGLLETNNELEHKNSFINEQNLEISVQALKLKEANDALVEAKEIIEEQKQQLEGQNKSLEAQVLEKTKEIFRVNEELIINNNELRQFSHTLSHNLKSPVATFQGLLNLIEINDLNDANKELLKYLNQSVDQMQMVFKDLNEILELRNKLYTSINHVDMQEQVDGLHSYFYPELRRNNIDFNCNCSDVRSIETNEKRLNGILYQLISNAIKFRSTKRKPEISLSLNGNDEYHSIKIRDNGLGIDLSKYESKMFYPYQKFHDGIAGKGLGLYLVKLQTESLGGKVKVASRVDEYTEVEVLLKK